MAPVGRMSARAARPGKSPRKRDPRDLQDKGYQKQAKQTVIAFLAEHRFPYEMSLKKLSSPTQKEFFLMVSFIVRFIDPAAPKELSNNSESIEYVITALKQFRYQFLPAKSTLQAVSSPLYWPAVLGVLEWLVNVATYTVRRAIERSKGQQVSSCTLYPISCFGPPSCLQLRGLWSSV
jgi:SMC interacting uncharacterized protein involved in chromosome segregation